VYIEPRQDELLKQWTAKTGMSEADIIRQALDQWLEDEEARHRRALVAWKEARAFIEAALLKGRFPANAPGTRRIIRGADESLWPTFWLILTYLSTPMTSLSR
jgi:hypothetical protein